MEDELELFESAAEEQMQNAVAHLDDTLQHIRAGKANPRILDPIKIDYYGVMSPLASCATITTPDARAMSIQPWEKTLIRFLVTLSRIYSNGCLLGKKNKCTGL